MATTAATMATMAAVTEPGLEELVRLEPLEESARMVSRHQTSAALLESVREF
jgi:hypothetical protein